MHTWHWQTWQGLPYLTCSLLEPWLHGFFTQQFWSRSPAELVEVFQPTAEVYRVKQVHGNVVLTPAEITQTDADQESLPPADGVVTEQAGQSVWVASADCTPVLIADSRTGQTAAVHSGWRGTAAKIVTVAIARLQTQGSQLADLRIALGPAISGAVYQVSTQVAAQVGATVHGSHDEEVILNILQRLPDAPILPDPEPGRVRLDVRRVIALQLEHLGINSEQVAIAPYCTYQEPQCFFSYRRDQQKKVQWSGIVSKNVN
ncbi:peptidoglycan editing factor PgeF [Gloeocapsopsis dulcis]|uniref:Purine nucleoside phosphorylase n=1 Tax=Gloeocapsopsis dulcis AAB1 = 1H9 TaxID=1433147 RepID=A0A6N8FXQ5_9CHRO|nr:peptidoglycan editing factor PgeF [Gloeocapsopsis dulcis]MUL36706.1 laccase [Gloeocapsopsis dulcis AAB1 = 1H9]WNN91279.1 peptidoglycan editing factor PgeF [Gloeocapsopsis dulcis]